MRFPSVASQPFWGDFCGPSYAITPYVPLMECNPATLTTQGDTRVFKYSDPYQVEASVDLFVVDNTERRQRFISRYKKIAPNQNFPPIAVNRQGFLTTTVRLSDGQGYAPAQVLEDTPMSHEQWGHFLWQAQNGLQLSRGTTTGVFMYNWIPEDGISLFSRTDNVALAVTPSSIMDLVRKTPETLLFDGMKLFVKATGIKELVINPEFLRKLWYPTIGGAGAFGMMYLVLPQALFWNVAQFSVGTGITLAVQLSTAATNIVVNGGAAIATVAAPYAQAAGETFLGTAAKYGGTAVHLGGRAITITYPYVKIVYEKFGGAFKPDPSGDNPLTWDRLPNLRPPPCVVYGCTDQKAKNFMRLATVDDGSCTYDDTTTQSGCSQSGCSVHSTATFGSLSVYSSGSGSTYFSCDASASTATDYFSINTRPGSDEVTYAFGGFSIELIPITISTPPVSIGSGNHTVNIGSSCLSVASELTETTATSTCSDLCRSFKEHMEQSGCAGVVYCEDECDKRCETFKKKMEDDGCGGIVSCKRNRLI